MKQFLIFSAILISINISAQKIECADFNNPKNSKWTIGVNYSQNYGFRYLAGKDDIANLIIDLRNERELPDLGFNTGITILYNLSENLSLESGLQFSEYGEKTKYIDVIINEHDSVFEPVLNGLQQIQYQNRYRYIDIPLKINYYLSRKKVSLYASLGLIPSIYYESFTVTTYKYTDRTEIKEFAYSDDAFNKFCLSALLSAGVDISVFNNFMLRVEPNIRGQLTSISSTSVKGHSYSGGINVGLFYNM